MSEQTEINKMNAREYRELFNTVHPILSRRMSDIQFTKKYERLFSDFVSKSVSSYIYLDHILAFVRPYIQGKEFTAGKLCTDGRKDFDARKTGIEALLRALNRHGLIDSQTNGKNRKYRMNDDTALVIASLLASNCNCNNGTCSKCNGTGLDPNSRTYTHDKMINVFDTINLGQYYYESNSMSYWQLQRHVEHHDASKNYCSDECIKDNHKKYGIRLDDGEVHIICSYCYRWPNPNECEDYTCDYFASSEICDTLIPGFIKKLSDKFNFNR
jgi:hypothetical protein